MLTLQMPVQPISHISPIWYRHQSEPSWTLLEDFQGQEESKCSERLSNHVLGVGSDTCFGQGDRDISWPTGKHNWPFQETRRFLKDPSSISLETMAVKQKPGRHLDLWSMAKASILSSNGPWIWQSYINQHPAQIPLVLLFKDPSCPVRNVPPRIATEDQLLQELQGGAHDLWITCCSTLWMSDRSDRW